MNSGRKFRGHAAVDGLAARDGELLIGGRTVTEIRDRVGRTPFYVYDKQAVSKRIETLRTVLPDSVDLHYAIKANPMPAVVRYMSGCVDGFDLASVGEMRIALDAGIAAGRLSFAGPGKQTDELRAAVEAGVTLHAESERELQELAEIAGELGKRPRVAIRVNPDFQLKTSGMKMGGGPQQFGIDAEVVPQVLSRVDHRLLELVGFHIFAGSQNLNAESIIEAQNESVALAQQLARAMPGPITHLNIGGGFGIPYFPGERPLDLKPIGANLQRLAARAAADMPGVRLILELGRYLVGEAGYYVCRVIERKVSRGQAILITDGGMHHHLAASGNFGQVIRKNYPVVIGTRMGSGETVSTSIVGPLCTPLDLLADKMALPKAGPGDLVVVLQSGAYGFSASPHGFLSHPEPAEILI